jgi:hypothetical protein
MNLEHDERDMDALERLNLLALLAKHYFSKRMSLICKL